MLLRRIARPLLSTAFIGRGLETLRNPDGAADAARPLLEHLPSSDGGDLSGDARQLVSVNATAQIAAGLLLASGKMPRAASAVLAATVLPANLGEDMFWAETDGERRAAKRRAFLTDISLVGGLIIAAADTAGRPSLGWRGRRAAERFSRAASETLHRDGRHPGFVDSETAERLADKVRSGAAHGHELADTAREKIQPMLNTAREHGGELAEMARKRGVKFAHAARDRGPELVEAARERGGELAERAQRHGPRKRRRKPNRFATALGR